MFSIEILVNRSAQFDPTTIRLSGSRDTTYEAIKNEIYQKLGTNDRQFRLKMTGRYYGVVNGRHEEMHVDVNSEHNWCLFYQENIVERRMWSVSLIADLIPAHEESAEPANVAQVTPQLNLDLNLFPAQQEQGRTEQELGSGFVGDIFGNTSYGQPYYLPQQPSTSYDCSSVPQQCSTSYPSYPQPPPQWGCSQGSYTSEQIYNLDDPFPNSNRGFFGNFLATIERGNSSMASGGAFEGYDERSLNLSLGTNQLRGEEADGGYGGSDVFGDTLATPPQMSPQISPVAEVHGSYAVDEEGEADEELGGGDDDEQLDLGPVVPDCETGEEYSEPEELSEGLPHPDGDSETEGRRDTLLVEEPTSWQHPCPALSDISGFKTVGASERQKKNNEEIYVGRIFKSKEHMIWALCHWAIRKNVVLRTDHSSQSKYVLICLDPKDKCNWRLYATHQSFSDSWRIATLRGPHTCKRPAGEKKHNQLTADMIASIIRGDLKERLDMSVDQIGRIVKHVYPGIKPTYNKCWRAKEKALGQLFGTWEDSYALLPRILNQIVRTNPGSLCSFLLEPHDDPAKRYFKCAVWAYGPCIQAAKYLRPVISIDAAFMSGRYQGKLFAACGYDAENQLIPLAFAIVKNEEDLPTWGWFMAWVRKNVLKDTGYDRWCVISDMHKGIKAVFNRPDFLWCERVGVAVHRLCMQHVCERLYKHAGTSTNKLKDTFKFNIAKKKNPRKFEQNMQKLYDGIRPAYDYLVKVGKEPSQNNTAQHAYHRWTQAYDGGHRWGIMTSNGSECLNKVFKLERTLPVVAIVEGTWYKCASWFDKRRRKAQARLDAGELFPKNIVELIEKRDNKAADKMHVVNINTDHGEFEVQVERDEEICEGVYGPWKYTCYIHPPQQEEIPADLPNPKCTCECQKPQLTGLPCSHVLAVCQHMRYDPYDLIDVRYSTKYQLDTWSGRFHSYGDPSAWPRYTGATIVPDPTKINRGRRKHGRRRMIMDRMEGRPGPSSQPQEPVSMADLQSGRRFDVPPSRQNTTTIPIQSQRTGAGFSRDRIQSARHSTSYDPTSARAASGSTMQPSRHSVSGYSPPRINRELTQQSRATDDTSHSGSHRGGLRTFLRSALSFGRNKGKKK